MPVGVMIEVPSAALTVDLLAAEADFFSIGTNDLIQFCLAVDRTDGRVAGLFEPLHPAILRVIRQVIRLARPRGRQVAVCGEMAADPGALLLLLGLGVTEFSMSPAAIPEARDLVRRVTVARRAARGGARAPPADVAGHRRLAGGPVSGAGVVAPRPRRPAAHGGSLVSGDVKPGVVRVDKPWGYELLWARTDRYVGKIIHVNAGHALSLQYHHVKTETVYLASGKVRYEIKDGDALRSLDLSPGDRLHIPAGTVHRVTALEDADIFEVSTPELDDVVRLEDRYGRAGDVGRSQKPEGLSDDCQNLGVGTRGEAGIPSGF